jgi:hypothetical protein
VTEAEKAVGFFLGVGLNDHVAGSLSHRKVAAHDLSVEGYVLCRRGGYLALWKRPVVNVVEPVSLHAASVELKA